MQPLINLSLKMAILCNCINHTQTSNLNLSGEPSAFQHSSLASLIFGQRPELKEKGDDYRRPLSKRPQARTKDEPTKPASALSKSANSSCTLGEYHFLFTFLLPQGQFARQKNRK